MDLAQCRRECDHFERMLAKHDEGFCPHMADLSSRAKRHDRCQWVASAVAALGIWHSSRWPIGNACSGCWTRVATRVLLIEQLAFSLAAFTAGATDGSQQLLVAERLAQKCHSAALKRPGLDSSSSILDRCDENNRNTKASLRELLLKLRAAHTGQFYVQDQAARSPPKRGPQKLLG
jgi:hypothetical protein